MSWFYRNCIRPVLFAQDPEAVQRRTLCGLGLVGRHRSLSDVTAALYRAPEMPLDLWGLKFPNPLGLAAGMDKEARAVPAWQTIGFGFCELGGVTWHPQPGNPIPRAFRAVSDQALINRMGSNNPGAEMLAQKLDAWRSMGRWPRHPVGINLDKSRITPLNAAAEDYANSFRVLWPYGDFFVVNVSSPNTPSLRKLQDKSALSEILTALQQVNAHLAARLADSEMEEHAGGESVPSDSICSPRLKPMLVKVAPDLAFEALDEILELVIPRRMAGIVATNTTVTRPQATDPKLQRVYAELGGLSGRPLRQRSTDVIRHLYRQTRGTLPIVGVGGIFNAEDAWKKITAGATLLQVYTGLIYEGPSLARTIIRGLQKKLRHTGLPSLQHAVGMTVRT